MVKVMSLLIKPESALGFSFGFSFGVRVQTENGRVYAKSEKILGVKGLTYNY